MEVHRKEIQQLNKKVDQLVVFLSFFFYKNKKHSFFQAVLPQGLSEEEKQRKLALTKDQVDMKSQVSLS